MISSRSFATCLLGAMVGGAVGEAVGVLPALDVAAVLVGLSGVVMVVDGYRSSYDSDR